MKKLFVILIIASSVVFISYNYKPNSVNEVKIDDNISVEEVYEEEIKEEIDVLPSGEEEVITEELPVSTLDLDNTTFAWGFVRKKDGVSPDFSVKYTKPLDQYDGIYKGSSDLQRIYLTFDEGYENGYTNDILDILLEKDVKATFFVTMPYVKQNQELVRRMIDEDHVIGNHTVNHPSMPSITDDEKLKKEVEDLHNYVLENFNYEMKYIRPPKGEFSERTVKICKDLGYTTVLWSSAYDDWDVNNQKGVEYAKKMIINYAHNGCVMLLHAVSKDNTEVLGEVIETLRDQEYDFYTLEDFER